MRKIIIILSVGALLLSQLQAEDTRDQVRNEILKSLDEVEKARQVAIDELRVTVKNIEDARKGSSDINQTMKSNATKIAESQALGNIAASTATVEIAKIHAKDKIIKAIVSVEGIESKNITHKKVDTKKALAVKKIVSAIATVEIAKAKAARTIIKATEKVEISKIKKKYHFIDDASALIIAKNISAVKIAKSVSAVEITKAVSNVKIAKALLDKNIVLSVQKQYKGLTLDEIKAKAKADISTITAKLEVMRAKALSDIAQIISFVEITEAIKLQKQNEKNIHLNKQISTYSKEFIILKQK